VFAGFAYVRTACADHRSHAKIGGSPAVFSAEPPLTYQPACKPGSVWPAGVTADVTAIPLVRRLPGASSNLPERLARTDPELALQRRSYSVLLPVGFAVPFPLLETRCALTAPFHPYLGQYTTQPRRSVLCGTVPEASPREGLNSAGRYPAPFVHGARTFLPGRLSALARDGRPADWRDRHGVGRLARQAKGRFMVGKKIPGPVGRRNRPGLGGRLDGGVRSA